MLKRRSFQEIDGQLESERKYVERLAVEDFGTTHVGKVSDDDDGDDDDYAADDDHKSKFLTQTSDHLVTGAEILVEPDRISRNLSLGSGESLFRPP